MLLEGGQEIKQENKTAGVFADWDNSVSKQINVWVMFILDNTDVQRTI